MKYLKEYFAVGRKVGYRKTEERYLIEHADVVECLKMGYTIRAVISITKRNTGTVQRAKKYINDELKGGFGERLGKEDNPDEIFLNLKCNEEIIKLFKEGKSIGEIAHINGRGLSSLQRMFDLIKDQLGSDADLQSVIKRPTVTKRDTIKFILTSDQYTDSEKVERLKKIIL